ncbi:inosine-5 -monophosphate dehydrogenase [mine drainage metagenome]|uniref:Inosine-5-monophosphate dehydrogenase n=1 Tax=mine drainage metagenome TaxID=410659 RepID=T0Y867_9ZZZZ
MEKAIICNSVKENPIFLTENQNLLDARDSLIESKLHSIPVCNKDQRLIGVITMDDILNVIPIDKSDDGIMLNISGLSTGDSDLYDIIYFLTDKFTQKISKVSGLNTGALNIHVMKHHSQGAVKYSIRTRFSGRRINMTISDYDWNFGKCLSRIFETYDKRMKRDLEKN